MVAFSEVRLSVKLTRTAENVSVALLHTRRVAHSHSHSHGGFMTFPLL